MLINKILLDIRIRSFFMDGELICECLALFFKMSIVGWVSLTVSEGISKFTVLNSEPGLLDLSEISDDFAYPVRSLKGLNKYLGLKILAVYEYRIKNFNEGCVGVYLDFGDYGLSIIESDECLSVVEGMMQYPDGDVSLYKIEI
jgi:hypothetical protein